MDTNYSQFTTTRKLLYSYLHLAPTSPNAEYILFLHGFPSSSYDWRHQIKFFSAKGYGIIAPDLLGYGDTDKSLDFQLYSGKGMAQDVKDILVHENIAKVIGVGHDW
jgi:soluble epoxide hydrolase/lipid-phosphate phosphatase